ncbi:MAG: glycoside hydrolase, partial [Saprospiraceae bacterium]|nr:glycoside hydrolase [Saprospiraceae bacterium]
MSQLDAGHFDNQTCYAAINRIRLDDLRPHIWRTHDGGKTWKEITRGLPDNEPINTVWEDPKQKGLLYAGSENAVYVSFDDGENWQSLRLNMPATSIRDLVVKDDDLVVGTHGRSFWILDNITPLRQQAAGRKSEKGVLLYQPQTAYRVRWNMNTDTPLPQEEPAGQNPPDGAMIDYVLEEDVENIYLTIEDAKGQILVYYTPEDLVPDVSGINFPLYWIRPKQVISGKKGAHRLVWDLHLVPLPNAFPEFPISATFNQTAQELSSPWVMPGFYNVVLHVNDNRFDQTIDVRMAPRVQTDLKDLKVQYDLALKCYEMRYFALGIMEYVVQKRKAIPLAYPSPTGTTADSINDLSKGLDALYQLAQSLNQNSKTLHDLVQESDFPP